MKPFSAAHFRGETGALLAPSEETAWMFCLATEPKTTALLTPMGDWCLQSLSG